MDDAQIEGDIDVALEHLRLQNPDIETFRGTAEKDGEPDFWLIDKHITEWIKTHPNEARDFLLHRREVQGAHYKDTGASISNDVRHVMDMPTGLYTLLRILSPNVFGHMELGPKARKKRLKKFLKQFPVFQVCKKY